MKIQPDILASALLVASSQLAWAQASCSPTPTYTFTPEQLRNANRTLSIGYVVYPGYAILDVFGPLQFLEGLSWPFSINLSIIAKTAGPVGSRPPPHHTPDGSIMDMSRMIDVQLIATHDFQTAPPLDILIMPGGVGDLHLVEQNDTAIEDFIASRFNTTEYVLSVCSGAGFLARAGVLEGRRATGTKAVWDFVTQFGTNITWVPSARWVEDGKVWTSSGVTAGMDMMVAFVRHLYGDPRVNNFVNNLEYLAHVDPRWDPFSVLHKVPGANMSIPLTSTVSPLQPYPEEA